MSAITERRDMSLYGVPLSMSFFLLDGVNVSQILYVWGYVVVSGFKHACEEG